MRTPARAGFTIIELISVLLAIVILLGVVAPLAYGGRHDSRLGASLNNLRLIVAAQAAYSNDHAGMVPIRGSRYLNGDLNGYSSWHVGGKNSDIEWASRYNGLFDESAYSRPLNVYLYPQVPIPVPAGYMNSGSGSTWTFYGGTPTPADRETLHLPIFQSPGDRVTYQSTWPNPGRMSSYDDVGSSYHVNMTWFFQPDLAPLSFTQRMSAGTQRMSNLLGTPQAHNFVFIADQTVERVFHSPPGTQIQGEFGGINMSAVGYLDGRAAYVEIVPGQPMTRRYMLHLP